MDLLIEESGNLVYALEFKSNPRVSGRDLTGVRSFKQAYPKVKIRIVVPFGTPYLLEDIPVLPLSKLLDEIL